MVEYSTELAFCLPNRQSEQRRTSMLTGTLFCQSSSMCLRKFSSFLHWKSRADKTRGQEFIPRNLFFSWTSCSVIERAWENEKNGWLLLEQTKLARVGRNGSSCFCYMWEWLELAGGIWLAPTYKGWYLFALGWRAAQAKKGWQKILAVMSKVIDSRLK